MSASTKAVFLSYASQDAAAVQRICDALRAEGVEVWFDRNELVGGDAWDAKIRKQIAECALFVPIISANTQARTEGYFRLEWKLAAQRTHMIADDAVFLLPVVIDDTRDADARVPGEFKAVQWTRLRQAYGGQARDDASVAAFGHRVKKLLGGSAGLQPSLETPGRGLKPRATPERRNPWLVPAVLGGLALVALAIWQPWKAPGLPPLSHQPAASATPDSKAASLVARARAIYETGVIANDEDLKLAERFAREATEVEPFNAEAWAARSLASAQILHSGFDESDVRRAEVLTAAQRAVKLDPDSVTAKLALAISLRLSPDTEPEAARIAQALAARPDASGMALLLQAKLRLDTAEAAPLFERLLAMPGFAAQAHYWKGVGQIRANRPPEAYAEFTRAVALAPDFAMAQSRRLSFLMDMADREELRRALETLPARLKTDSGIASTLFMVYWRLRDGDKAVRVLENLPQEYIQSKWLRGPKAMYLGLAHRVAGRREAAMVEWQGALRTMDKRLAAGKTESEDVFDRGWLLALLGREAEALDSLRLYEQLRRIPVGRPNGDTVMLYAELGREELVATFFTEAFSNRDASRAAGGASVYLLMDCYDRYRELPRFREINRRAEELVANARLPAATAKSVPPPAAAVVPKADDKSVAVLAFKNLSGDPGREFFSDGLSEAVTDVLGRVPGLKVVGSASAFSFKGKSVPIPEIARQLGVTHLVEGTVLQEGQTVRITAKLIQADGFQVWVSEKLDRELKNIFALHDEVAGLIAKNLSLKLGASSAAATAAVNPQAFELYVQARQAWNRRTPEGFDLAESLLTRALAFEPSFARAHAALADVWMSRRTHRQQELGSDGQPNSAELAKIHTKITHALTLDPDSAEPQASLGLVLHLDGKNATAESALRRALALNPNYASAHAWLGRVLFALAEVDAALGHHQRATELDPLSTASWFSYGSALTRVGQFSAGVSALGRALTLQPNYGMALRSKASALALFGRMPEAVALARTLPADDMMNAPVQLLVFARAGLKADAEALLADPRSSVNSARELPRTLLTLGRNEEALALMTPQWIRPSSASDYLFGPLYDSVRNDPRWVKLMADVGLTAAHARAQAWRKAHPPEKAK